MPQPTRSDVHVNRPLTQMSIAYLQDQNEFVAGKVFPILPVRKQSDSYFVYPKGNWFRTEAKYRAPSTESAGSGYDVSTDTYSCVPQALHKDIDDQIRSNADEPIDLDAEGTEFVTRGLALRREKDWMSRYFTTSVWTGAADFTPSTLWSVLATATPITDIRTKMGEVKKKTGFRPNTLVLAEDVWLKVQDTADFLNRIAITRDKIVTPDLLASVLQLDRVLIAGGIENTAEEGATDAMDWVATKDALLVYAAPRPSLMLPSGGYTFSWTGYTGAGMEGNRINRFRMEHLRSDRIEGEMAYDLKLVASDLGVFFNNCIA